MRLDSPLDNCRVDWFDNCWVILGSEGSANGEYFLMGKISGCIVVATTLISCWGLVPYAKKPEDLQGKQKP